MIRFCLATLLLICSVSTDATHIDFPNGFPCDTSADPPTSTVFTLNDVGAPNFPKYRDNGNGQCFLRLLNNNNNAGDRGVSALLDFVFDPANTKKTFSMEVGYRISGSGGGTARRFQNITDKHKG